MIIVIYFKLAHGGFKHFTKKPSFRVLNYIKALVNVGRLFILVL